MWDEAREFIRELVFHNRDRHAIPVLDGPYKPNKGLDEFQVACDFLQNPDDIAIDAEGALYVSTENCVVKLSGKNHQEQQVYIEFEDGFPGGLNFHPDGQLMVCVGGKGVVLINDDGHQTWIEMADGKPIRCPTSAIAARDGRIFISDGTAYHDPHNWVFDLMEKRSAGRLICYEKDTETTQVVLSGLSYPNGLAITHDSTSIIICESWKHTVSAYPIDDIQPGTEEPLIPNLPGYPARVVQSSDGGYWMSLFAMRTNLVEFILTERKYREKMMKTIDPNHWAAPALCSGKDFFEPLQGGGIKQLGITKPWAPPRSYGLVIKFDQDFDAVGSFHSRVDGMRHGITGLAEINGNLFVVSKGGSLILKGTEEVGA